MLSINKSLSEENLIEGCRKGKPSAQRELYERLAPKFLGMCIRYIKDREEAEHVMIGGLAKVFERLSQYKGEGSFQGWARKIVVNNCLMYLRKNRNMSLETNWEEVKDAPNLKIIEHRLEAEDLLKLINELPIGYRTVFNLYAIEGYSHSEIAVRLEISENTSKSQLSRARKWLQSRLMKIENEIKNPTPHESRKY